VGFLAVFKVSLPNKTLCRGCHHCQSLYLFRAVHRCHLGGMETVSWGWHIIKYFV